MAVPHYAYLKLKMLGPAGIITVKGSFTKSDQCDHDFHKVSDTFGSQQQLKEIAMVTDKNIFPLANRSETKEFGRDFSIDSDTITHQVHPTDRKKTICVYAHLPEEQATALITILREGRTIFAWCLADIKPNTKPVNQALRRFSEPKRREIGEEVNRLI